MSRLHRFLNLPTADRALLVRSVFWVGTLRLGLWLLPFRLLRQLVVVAGRCPAGVESPDSDSPARIGWAVKTAGRCIPRATCLTQALAAQVMLLQHGCRDVQLRIGVYRREGPRLEAHAWVNCGGRAVVGTTEDLARFTLLPPVDLS